MTGVFHRGLSEALLKDLLHGPCRIVLQACLDAGLDVRIRDNYLNCISAAAPWLESLDVIDAPQSWRFTISM